MFYFCTSAMESEAVNKKNSVNCWLGKVKVYEPVCLFVTFSIWLTRAVSTIVKIRLTRAIYALTNKMFPEFKVLRDLGSEKYDCCN